MDHRKALSSLPGFFLHREICGSSQRGFESPPITENKHSNSNPLKLCLIIIFSNNCCRGRKWNMTHFFTYIAQSQLYANWSCLLLCVVKVLSEQGTILATHNLYRKISYSKDRGGDEDDCEGDRGKGVTLLSRSLSHTAVLRAHFQY